MYKKLNYKIIISLILIILSIYFLIPNFINNSKNKINLGLDIQGGIHMLLGIDEETFIKDYKENIIIKIEQFFKENHLNIKNIDIDNNKIIFNNIEKTKQNKFINFLKTIILEKESYKITEFNNKIEYLITEIGIKNTKKMEIDKTVDVIRDRLNEFGLSNPNILKDGNNQIIVELSGIKTNEETKKIRTLISKKSKLEFKEVLEIRNFESNIKSNESTNVYILNINNEKALVRTKKNNVIIGDNIISSQTSFDEKNNPVIIMNFDSEGTEIYKKYTSNNINKSLVILLDNEIISMFKIAEKITGGVSQIKGFSDLEDVSKISILMKSGSFNTPVKLLEKRTVGASLGEENINKSLIAMVSGFLLILIFLYFYYGVSGLIINISLLINLMFILSIMSIFSATLTLPGIAGIILTIGMSVDANILINEKIKELINNDDNNIFKIINESYKKTFLIIFDSNFTTLMVAILLFHYGTSSLKGLGLTISIGIFTSMITTFLFTKGIYEILEKSNVKINTKKWFKV